MADKNMVNFTVESFKRFKKAYASALEDKKESFVFEGKEVVTGYAKYMIEYLEPQFGKIK